MKAGNFLLLQDFIGVNKVIFQIPVYQRNYDWSEDNVKRLLDDLKTIIDTGEKHFLGTIVYLPPEDHDVAGTPRMKGCGKPFPDVELRIVGEDGQDRAPGEVGEVWVRAPLVINSAGLHAPTLGTSWGTGGIVTASILYFSVTGGRLVFHELLIGIFVTVTTPVTFMLLARAALHRDRAEQNGNVPPKQSPEEAPAEGRSS